MKITFILFFVLFFLESAGFAHPSDEIRTACGGRARIAWCQDAGDGTDTGAEGNNLRLMGLDTDDRKGERCILTNLSNYAKPLFTPDGERIVFSNRQKGQIHVVGWNDPASLKMLAAGFALAVWRDPLTETDWVYAGAFVSNAVFLTDIRRFRLDKPEISENVWSKTPLDIDNFQLSSDGKYACGVFPWPSCGIAALPDREWKKFGDGCWPSLSPDNNLLLWIFDGAHRNLTLFRARTDERWVVNINNAPGIDGFEAYHPRWSNHPLFMVMTGPYKLGNGSNRIHGGGKDVEIYLGKFSNDFKKIERWIRVTHNEYADFFPDAWLATPAKPAAQPEEQQTGQALTGPAGSGLPENKKASADAWPISYEGLVFFWQNRTKANTFNDPITQSSYACRVEAKGRARYGRHFEMAPAGGAFIADGGKGELINACAASRQLGLEALITPYSTGNTNLLPIIGYAAQTGSWNFLLGQEGNRLIFQLRSAGQKPDYMFELGALAANQPGHVIVSCSSSAIACYLNGTQIFSADSVYGGNWERGKIVFGKELRGEYNANEELEGKSWKGLIENVALYSRWIGLEEARKKFKAGIACAGEKKQVLLLTVNARLLDMPAIPAPAAIAPYRRALAIGHYRIEKILEGKCSSSEILIARWAILDGQVINSTKLQPGAVISMQLELFSDHPELEGERLILESERYDLPMYYEVGCE